jgi:hypothetical protein
MLARAPGDVAHAHVAQVNVPRQQRGSPRPAWGNGAVCPATPGANAHGVPRTAVTSANGAPSRPAGRVQPCRFDLLPPCTPITARQRTRRPDRASRAARTGPLPGDQATVPPQDGARRDQPARPHLPGRNLISAASTARRDWSHRAPARCGAAPRPRAAARAVPHPRTPTNDPAGQAQPANCTKSDRADATTRPVIMPDSHAAPIAPGHSHRPASGTPQVLARSRAGVRLLGPRRPVPRGRVGLRGAAACPGSRRAGVCCVPA